MAPLPRQVGWDVGSSGNGGGGIQCKREKQSVDSLSALSNRCNTFSSCLDFPVVIKCNLEV